MTPITKSPVGIEIIMMIAYKQATLCHRSGAPFIGGDEYKLSPTLDAFKFEPV
jgi:hypothetical protein